VVGKKEEFFHNFEHSVSEIVEFPTISSTQSTKSRSSARPILVIGSATSA